jgi:hypothetical protein
MDRPYPVMHGTVEKAKNEGAARSGARANQPARSCHVARSERGDVNTARFTLQSNHGCSQLGSWSYSEHPVSRSIRLRRWQGCHSSPSTPGLRRRRKRHLCLSLRRPVLPTLLKNVNTVDFSNHSGAQQKVAAPPIFV